jgi:aspartate/methionine/tyrosine aminotransferase
MEAIAQIAIENDLWVLADEAYCEMRYSGTSSRSRRCRAWPSGPSCSTRSPRSSR